MRNIYDLNGVARQLLTCGVRRDRNDNFIMDFKRDYPNDILDLVGPTLMETRHGARVYWFGYEFKDHVDSHTRSDFIRYLKGFGDRDGMSENDLERFIVSPIAALDTKISTQKINCLIYPESNRSTLVGKIRRAILRESQHSTTRLRYDDVIRMSKLKERDVRINWEDFEEDYKNDRNKKQVEDILLDLEYRWKESSRTFSISRSLPDNVRKLRNYIENYIDFPDERTKEKFFAMEKPNILVIDDTLTSGATVDEIIRALTSYEADNSIYIYTLLNNKH